MGTSGLTRQLSNSLGIGSYRNSYSCINKGNRRILRFEDFHHGCQSICFARTNPQENAALILAAGAVVATGAVVPLGAVVGIWLAVVQAAEPLLRQQVL